MHGKSFILRLKLFKPELDHLATHQYARPNLLRLYARKRAPRFVFHPMTSALSVSVSFCLTQLPVLVQQPLAAGKLHRRRWMSSRIAVTREDKSWQGQRQVANILQRQRLGMFNGW